MEDLFANVHWPSFWTGVGATALFGVIGALVIGVIGGWISD